MLQAGLRDVSGGILHIRKKGELRTADKGKLGVDIRCKNVIGNRTGRTSCACSACCTGGTDFTRWSSCASCPCRARSPRCTCCPCFTRSPCGTSFTGRTCCTSCSNFSYRTYSASGTRRTGYAYCTGSSRCSSGTCGTGYTRGTSYADRSSYTSCTGRTSRAVYLCTTLDFPLC